VLSIVATALFVLKSPRVATVFAVGAVLNLIFVLPLYVGSSATHGARSGVLRAMLINVYTGNTDHETVLAAIRKHDPDFVLVEEINWRWAEALSVLDDRYRPVAVQPRSDNFGIALLSKHRAVDTTVLAIGDLPLPSILAEFEIEGDRFFILGTHAVPPVNRGYAETRNRHLDAIPDIATELDGPVLLLGDLNASPWSHHFRKLIRESGLRDASKGRGPQPTWPTHNLALRIPIDHALHSPGIVIVDKRIGARVGSDHYPVIVDFAVSEADPGEPEAGRGKRLGAGNDSSRSSLRASAKSARMGARKSNH
jgi:endonuclease/exonuclease/phosphatase (EEP) superfamily protein YafD